MLPPLATARGVSPAAVAAPRVRSSRSSVPSPSRCAGKLLKGMVGGENIWLACSFVGVAIARACQPSACHVPGAV
eukprot:760121-Pleurochrysis_carterae.AAC.1